MPRIYIANRSQDQAIADKIAAHLSEKMGAENILDSDSHDPATIRQNVNQSDLVLAIMGPGWAELPDESGNPALHNPDHRLRIALEAGQAAYDVRVIPVLIEGAELPDEEGLPPNLRAIVGEHPLQISGNGNLEHDLKWVVGYTQRKPLGDRAVVYGTVIFAALAFFAILALYSSAA